MDKILDAARAARTDAGAEGFYEKFQVLALEDPPGVIPYVINHINAYRKNVKGFQSSPMMWLDLRQVSMQISTSQPGAQRHPRPCRGSLAITLGFYVCKAVATIGVILVIISG